MPLYDGRYLENTYDDLTGHKCNIFFQVTFHNWKDMEDLIGEPLPKIFVGYSERGILGYNGNSILDAVDAVGDIISPLYGGKRPSNGEKYDSCYFDVWMGFSKAGWKKVYENWLRNTGRESEIERIKQEKKEKAKKENQKRDLPARLYEPSSFILNCENSEELIQIEKELDSVFPGKRIGSISTVNKVNVISASTSIKVKENKEKIEKLKELGWHTGRKYKGSDDCFYVNLSKNVSQKK